MQPARAAGRYEGIPEAEDMTMQHFQVQGMSCAHCERAVTEAAHRVDPQASVTVARSTVTGAVAIDSALPAPGFVAAIAAEGYTVHPG
jgi:copper chaperone